MYAFHDSLCIVTLLHQWITWRHDFFTFFSFLIFCWEAFINALQLRFINVFTNFYMWYLMCGPHSPILLLKSVLMILNLLSRMYLTWFFYIHLPSNVKPRYLKLSLVVYDVRMRNLTSVTWHRERVCVWECVCEWECVCVWVYTRVHRFCFWITDLYSYKKLDYLTFKSLFFKEDTCW